jgi:hypothetical protein
VTASPPPPPQWSRRTHTIVAALAVAIMVGGVWEYTNVTDSTSTESYYGAVYSVVVTVAMLVAAVAIVTMPKR